MLKTTWRPTRRRRASRGRRESANPYNIGRFRKIAAIQSAIYIRDRRARRTLHASSLLREVTGTMLQHLLSFVTLVSVCIAGIATYITVRHNGRQLGAQIFLAYSDRVRELRKAAALDVRDIDVIINATFLIFELYELRRRGYVSSSIWSIWDRDIADLLRTDYFRAQWGMLRPRLHNHAHFVNWVDAQLEAIAFSAGQ